MNYITILTPDNIEIEYRLAGAGSRLAAAAIDLFIQGAAAAVLLLSVLFTVFEGSVINIRRMENLAWAAAVVLILLFIIVFGYYIAAEILTNGQTAGKRLLGLRVIRENGAPIGPAQSVIRNLIKLTLDASGIGIITMMFTKKCKRIGDMAASTVVVAENTQKTPLIRKALLNFAAAQETAPGIKGGHEFYLSDKENKMIKEFFAVKDTFTDGGALVLNYLSGYFSEKFSLPADSIDETALRKMLQNRAGL